MSAYNDEAEEVDMTNIHLKVGEDNEDLLLPVERRAAITQFKVFARLRPFIAEELETINKAGKELRSTIEMKGNSTFPLNPNNDWKPSHEFVFDRSLWSIPHTQVLKPTPHFYDNKHDHWVNQEEMYEIATRDENGVSMVDNAFLAMNSCVLAYGQTSSGKTHTMMGKYGADHPPELRGIIPRVCDELFKKVKERREFEERKTDPSKRWELAVDVTFVEIYLEKVRDLLDPELKHKAQKQAVRAAQGYGPSMEAGNIKEALAAMKEAKVRRDPVTGPFVEGIKHVPVHSWQDCVKVLESGSQHRTTAVTSVHDNSSRSHAIFTITLVQKRLLRRDRQGDVFDKKSGRINLVDLAGSERGGGTSYVHESAAINKSLMALRRVIDALADRQEKIFERQAAELKGLHVATGQLPHVPYMDSVLTQLLQDSIGGNAKTVMIANMTPYWEFYEETLRTLEWSQKAKRLVTVVRTNIDESGLVKNALKSQLGRMDADLRNQKASVDSLKEELERRQRLIDNLQEKSEKTRQRIDQLNQEFADCRAQRAATTIQLAFYLWNFRRVRARRRKAVQEAENASAAAKKELRALEDKCEALEDALKRHNITMGRIKRKAEEVANSTDESIANAANQQQKKPEELRAELQEKQDDVKRRREELVGLQADQARAEELLQQYQEQREKDEVRRESDKAEAADNAAAIKAEVLAAILGAKNDGEYANILGGGMKIGDSSVPLFEVGIDGKWVPSAALEEQLGKVNQAKKDSDARLSQTETDKKTAEATKATLKQKIADENKTASALDAQIKTLNGQIAEEKKKCCH